MFFNSPNMIELYRNHYFLVSFEEANELFHYVFFEATELMKPEEYIEELTVFIDLVKKYKPKRVLGDMINFKFVITPDIQEWVNENLFSVYIEIGFKKIAILLSTSFVEQVSIQQTLEEAESGSFATAYFDDEKTALAWLLN